MTVGQILVGIACFWAGYLYRRWHERPAYFLTVHLFRPLSDASSERMARDLHPERN